MEIHVPSAVKAAVGKIGVAQHVLLACLLYTSRSKQAAAMLARLGYTNIFEFGGIMTWPYEVTAE